MANETYWEITFIDSDNIEKTETFSAEVEFENRFFNLYTDLKLPILNTTSGSNA